MIINVNFGPQNYFHQIEIGLVLSCLFFGFMFDIVGRKQIFMMRLMVTSIATILVPFITFFPCICLALVMSSVSLTVPFIPDLVKFHKRGLAYAYLGIMFIFAILIVFGMIQLEFHRDFDIEWIFVGAGMLGISTDLLMCWGFNDNYKQSLLRKRLQFR